MSGTCPVCGAEIEGYECVPCDLRAQLATLRAAGEAMHEQAEHRREMDGVCPLCRVIVQCGHQPTCALARWREVSGTK